MTVQTDPAVQALEAQWSGPWREDVPVFGCCRHAVTVALVHTKDLREVALLQATERVEALTGTVNRVWFDQADTHACCKRHIVDLALDLPAALASA